MKSSKVVILGGGESGCYAAILGKAKGYEVFLSDCFEISPERKILLANHQIPYEESKHTKEKILDAGIVVKSPGIAQTHPLIKEIRQAGIPVISEIEWAYRFQSSKIIAISGSNGKTTTTRLVHHLLVCSGIDAVMAGNIGDSFSRYVCGKHSDVVVLELSSFQLEDIEDFKPEVAILLNITPDHLDRYDYNMDAYAAAKINMLRNQSETDHYIYNAEDPYLSDQVMLDRIPTIKHPVRVVNWTPEKFENGDGVMFNVTRSSLKGRHNAFNICAAAEAVKIFGVSSAQVQASLDTFVNEAHRLEKVAEINEVEFINDSKATNVDAVFYALEAMQKPIIWIVGGQDKGNDYKALDSLVKNKVKSIIALGVDNSKIIDHFSGYEIPLIEVKSMEDAVDQSIRMANKGDVVLLSPACASFDLFNNYRHRGDLYKELINDKK